MELQTTVPFVSWFTVSLLLLLGSYNLLVGLSPHLYLGQKIMPHTAQLYNVVSCSVICACGARMYHAAKCAVSYFR